MGLRRRLPMPRLVRYASMLLAGLLPLAACVGATVVTFPRPESDQDARNRYPYLLLGQALQRSGRDYRLRYSRLRMQQGRALLQLEKGEGIDIVSFMTSAERETRLLPVRIPIDKGLVGWRLVLINKSQAARWSQIRSVDEIRLLTAGQGSDWPDSGILRANGFRVYGTFNYDSLFRMLERQRFDYFPRSINEVWTEADAHKTRLMVEPRFAFRYVTASYFFVRKDQAQLAEDITQGLERMIADGSFERLFQQYYGEVIRRSQLKVRQIIELDNPLLPDGIPVEQRKLLFRQ